MSTNPKPRNPFNPFFAFWIICSCLWLCATNASLFGQMPPPTTPTPEEIKWKEKVLKVWNLILVRERAKFDLGMEWTCYPLDPKEVKAWEAEYPDPDTAFDQLISEGSQKGFAIGVTAKWLTSLETLKVEPATGISPAPRQIPKGWKFSEREALLRKNAVLRVAPEYPPLPKNRRLFGDVQVEATIDPDGSVIATRRLKGHPLLYEAAESAAKKWRFRRLKEFTEPMDVTKPFVGVLTFRFTV